MLTALAVVGVLAVLFVAAVVATREGPVLADAPADLADVALPAGVLAPEDLQRVRFGLTVRGYRMSEVDEVLVRVAAELTARDERISALQLAAGEVPAVAVPLSAAFATPGPENELADAALRSTATDVAETGAPAAEAVWVPSSEHDPADSERRPAIDVGRTVEAGPPALPGEEARSAAPTEATPESAPRTGLSPVEHSPAILASVDAQMNAPFVGADLDGHGPAAEELPPQLDSSNEERSEFPDESGAPERTDPTEQPASPRAGALLDPRYALDPPSEPPAPHRH